VNDQHPRAAVSKDICCFVQLEMPIDRAGIEAAQATHQHADEESGIVPQHQRNDVSLLTSELLQSRDAPAR
jgi:hypothetical protein